MRKLSILILLFFSLVSFSIFAEEQGVSSQPVETEGAPAVAEATSTEGADVAAGVEGEISDVVVEEPVEEVAVLEEEWRLPHGYDKASKSIAAVGYGYTDDLATVSAYRLLSEIIDEQLTYRMNAFVSGTLLDFSDYARYYAVNKDRLVTIILERSEPRKSSIEIPYLYTVVRVVSEDVFDSAFENLINSATAHMGVPTTIATEASMVLEAVTGSYKRSEPEVLKFVDGNLV